MFCCGGIKIEAQSSSLEEIRKPVPNNLSIKINQFKLAFDSNKGVWNSKFKIINIMNNI